MSLEIDFETRSDIDLRKRGAYVYFDSPHTDPLMASYTINGGALRRWRPPAPCPADIRSHVEAGGMISAHNASFERLLWQKILTPRYGWPVLRTEQTRCTAATAAAMSLPRDLAGVGAALGLDIQKDKSGYELIKKFSIQRRNTNAWNTQTDFPEDFERFHDYCDKDVRTEAAADRRMVSLSTEEQDLYSLDQIINDRGIRIDRRSVVAALELVDKAKAELDHFMNLATDGYVTACSQVGRLTTWIHAQGVHVTTLGKAELEELLTTEDLPNAVRHAIEIRQEAAKTSVAKLGTFLDRCSDDGRLRGAFLFHAAGTGRWSSTGAQIHNLPRPRKIFSDAGIDPARLFQEFRVGSASDLRTSYGDILGRPLHLLSDAIRGFIWSAPGKDLLVADYSGIEGAIAAWFADEEWKTYALFRIMADPSLPDMYRQTAAGIFNTTPEEIPKSDARRQIGKVAELALGYQGGVGAFRSMARGNNMNLDAIFPYVWEAADEERRDQAVTRYDECLERKEPTTQHLSRDAWVASELVKIGWRATNSAIAAAWPALEAAVKRAIANPGEAVEVLKVAYIVRQGFLWCRLPSGRCLAYGKPQMRDMVVPWADRTQPEEKQEKRPTPTALGVNSVTKKWERFALYGGLAFENIVQAIARDLLANGLRRAEAAGYPVIGHVHDEILTEVPRGWGDVEAFEKLICELPPWAYGLPLTASGWRGKRYRKG